MKKGFYLLIFVIAVTLMVSCGRNEVKQSLQQMEKIVEKAEKEKDKLSKEEWKTLAEQFEAQEKKLNEASEADRKLRTTTKLLGILMYARRLESSYYGPGPYGPAPYDYGPGPVPRDPYYGPGPWCPPRYVPYRYPPRPLYQYPPRYVPYRYALRRKSKAAALKIYPAMNIW